MQRQLDAQRPDSFVFNPDWATCQIAQYPEVGSAGVIIGTMDVVFGEIDR